MNNFILITSFLILFSKSSAVIIEKPCDYYNLDSGRFLFNITQFLGKWYELKTYSSDIEAGKCVYDDFKKEDRTGKITLTHTEIGPSQTENSTGVVIINGRNELTWTFTVTRLDVIVLQTDYTSFAILWSCRNEGPGNSTQYLWVWGRSWIKQDVPWSLVNLTLYNSRIMDNNIPLNDVPQDFSVCDKNGDKELLTISPLLIFILLLFTGFII